MEWICDLFPMRLLSVNYRIASRASAVLFGSSASLKMKTMFVLSGIIIGTALLRGSREEEEIRAREMESL